MIKRNILLTIICVIIITFTGCQNNEEPVIIDSGEVLLEPENKSGETEIVFGVFCFDSTVSLFLQYRPLTDYLSKKTGEKIRLKLFRSNNDLFESLKREEIDIALISDAMYSILRLNEVDNYSIIGTPVYEGSANYNCEIIVNSDSIISEVKDLKGKSFAFFDMFSVPGYYFPLKKIGELNMKPDEYFSAIYYVKNLHDLLNFILNKRVSAVCIPSYYFNLYRRENLKDKIKVIEISDAFIHGPFIIKNSLDDEIQVKIIDTLFEVHNDKEGRKILENIHFDKIEKSTPGDYSKSFELVKKYYKPE
ncbi:MAG: PhnD/SsuA/transferrin family substrate-binding protein [bacterium]|nr:PhnD/SsuA/transferrin family substrate-binding protein [bacterium]